MGKAFSSLADSYGDAVIEGTAEALTTGELVGIGAACGVALIILIIICKCCCCKKRVTR